MDVKGHKEDTDRAKSGSTSCTYRNSSIPIRVCTRWMSGSLKIHYVFLGNRGDAGTRTLLRNLERNILLTKEERELLQRHLPETVLALPNPRFVFRSIFTDDTRIQTLLKVVRFVQEYYQTRQADFPSSEYSALLQKKFVTRKDLPIAWSYRKHWLFHVDNTWDQWKANPWLYDSKTINEFSNIFEKVTKSPVHEYIGDELSLDSPLHFTFSWDIPITYNVDMGLLNWHTLWNDALELSSWEQVNYEEGRLSELWGYTSIHKNIVKLDNCLLQEYHETGTYRTKNAFINIYDTIPISKKIPFIQWVGDKYHILYRVYKQHPFDEGQLQSLLDVSRLPPESRITIVWHIQQTPVDMKLVLMDSDRYYITVKTSGYPLPIHKIHHAVNVMKEDVRKWFGIRMTNSQNDVRAKLMLRYRSAFSNSAFFQELAKYGWIFSVKETEARQQRIHLLFLRSMSSHQRVRLDDFIRTQLMFLENEDELISAVQDTFGVNATKASDMIQQYRSSQQFAESFTIGETHKKWLQIPSSITITRNGQNLQVACERFANMEDIYRMAHWLQGTCIDIALRLSSLKEEPSQVPDQPLKPKEGKKVLQLPQEISVSASPVSSITRSASSLSSSAPASRRSKSSSLGGGAYDLNEELKQADPVVFKETTLPNNPSRYPRLCSANTNQQPVVVSQKDMERIDQSEFKEAYDNKILYGSDKDIANHKYYFCPRIWCPISKVPMTYEMLHSDKYKGKCPGPHFEDPWLMYDVNYWGKDPKKTHYVGFHSKQGTNGLCLPCCKIHGQKDQEENPMWKKCTSHVKREKEKEAKVSESVPGREKEPEPKKEGPDGTKKRGRKAKVTHADADEEREDYYLLHIDAPTHPNRWGVLPEKLHRVFSPKQSYTSCFTQLKSDNPCLVRKGIHHHKDSMMNALGYVLTGGRGGKREFMEMLVKRITPMEFLSLENGWWLASLLDKDPVLPQTDLAEILQWKEWVQSFPTYISMFKLTHIVMNGGASLELSREDQLRLSRELSIYRAWKRFWEYMKSTEPKELYLMYDIMRHLGVHLLVWEKVSPEKVYLRCPMPSTLSEVYKTLYDDSKPYVMLMYENNYYEPIELKSRGADGVTLLDDSELVHRLKQMQDTCGTTSNISNDPVDIGTYIQKYVLLRTFPETVFSILSFTIKKLVLDSMLMITGVMLQCGIYVKWESPIPLCFLSDLVHVLGIHHIVYHEDIHISGKQMLLPSRETLVFMKLLQELGMSWNVSSIEEIDSSEVRVTTTPILSNNVPLIPTTTMNYVHDKRLQQDSDQRHWVRLQRLIGSKLMKVYSSVVEPLLNRPKEEQLHHLQSMFQNIPFAKKVRTILEEIPLHTKDSLRDWYLRIGSHKKYPFYSNAMQEGQTKHEWMFSQGVLHGGELNIPLALRRPSKVMHPPNLASIIGPVRTLMRPKEMSVSAHKEGTNPIPQARIEWTTLPSKWLVLKKYEWQEYRLCSSSDATYDMHNALTWLSKQYQVPLSNDLLHLAHQLKMASVIEGEDMEILEVYLQDPGVWKGIGKLLRIEKSKSSTIIKHFLRLSKQEQWNTWLSYFTSLDAHPVDLDILLFARLTDSVVMVLHRSPSGVGVEANDRNRFQDFVSSATVYHSPQSSVNAKYRRDIKDKPWVVFYKKSKQDAELSRYDWVVHKGQSFYFKKGHDAPKMLQQLLDAVVQAQKE